MKAKLMVDWRLETPDENGKMQVRTGTNTITDFALAYIPYSLIIGGNGIAWGSQTRNTSFGFTFGNGSPTSTHSGTVTGNSIVVRITNATITVNGWVALEASVSLSGSSSGNATINVFHVGSSSTTSRGRNVNSVQSSGAISPAVNYIAGNALSFWYRVRVANRA